MFVELHMIQNFAPSCLNRDDTNAPKDCEFGGYRRARISSQCLKRAIRMNPEFSEVIGQECSNRTKLVLGDLARMVEGEGKDSEEARETAKVVLESLFGKMKDDSRTKVLLFLGKNELNTIKEVLMEYWDDLASGAKGKIEKAAKEASKKIENALKQGPLSPDIALFGRMMAEKPELNKDAASQVAHAISTHATNMEMDFYTAVDDLQTGEETGAGMMGTVEFNSSCFYRYANVDVGQLLTHFNGDKDLVVKTVEGFIRASVAAIPTGKQNSMAAHNLPYMVLVTFRKKSQPWSLANAFVTPVKPTLKQNLVESSILALDRHLGDMLKMYATQKPDYMGYAKLGDTKLLVLDEKGSPQGSFEELIDNVRGLLNDSVASQN